MRRPSSETESRLQNQPPKLTERLRRFFGRTATSEVPEAEVEEAPRANDLSFKPNTIQNPIMPGGGRDLAHYEKYFLFDRAELAGKNVLDLGAGPEAKLAHELEESDSPPSIVVSFSPDLADAEHAQTIREAYDRNLVAGVGQALPFADKSFDEIMALFVFNHLPSKEAWLDMVEECARVLKPGGSAKVGPLIQESLDGAQTIAEENAATMERLAGYGVEIRQEELPMSTFSLRSEYGNGPKRWLPGGIFVLEKKGSNEGTDTIEKDGGETKETPL